MRTNTDPRRFRLSLRRWRPSVGLLVAAAVGALLPTAAFATHAGFGDGPFAPHAAGVHYMGETGITAGCGDGSNYCPDDAVTRAQMATFLHRMSGNGSIPPNVDAATLDGLSVAQLNPVAVATGADAIDQTTPGLVDLDGATVEVTIPEGRTGLLLARFSAESACTGGSGWCQATIMVDGAEANPAVGRDFAFDSPDDDSETGSSWESHAMDRSVGPLAAGTYTVTVQTDLISAGSFQLDDWQLVAEVKLLS